jgi:hypothetical protein
MVIQAACGLISSKPGVANTTNLTGHLPETVKCTICGAEYHVDYNPNDLARVQEYEPKLRDEAQRLINADHGRSRVGHTGFIHVHRLN